MDQEGLKQRKGDRLTLLTRCISGGDYVRVWSVPVQLGIAEREPGVRQGFWGARDPHYQAGSFDGVEGFPCDEVSVSAGVPGVPEGHVDQSQLVSRSV